MTPSSPRQPWPTFPRRSARWRSRKAPARSRAPASIASSMVATSWRGLPSALDGRGVERGPVGVAGEEHRERDRCVRRELELGKALLAEAVVESPLKGAELALRHAIRGPRGVRLLRAVLLGEI